MRLALFRILVITVMVAQFSFVTVGQESETNFDKRFREYAKMDPSQRVQAFSMETPAMKVALFKRNLYGKANKLTLSKEQRKFLQSSYLKLTPEAFIEGTPENEAMKATDAEIQTLFTEKEIKALFIVKELGAGIEDTIFFGEISFRTSITDNSSYACYCIGGSDCPDGPGGNYTCELYMHGCTPGGSCGTWGLHTCRGGCKWNSGGELELT